MSGVPEPEPSTAGGAPEAPRLARPSGARAEWHRLEEVIVHRPGIEMFFGLLEPYSFLYERAFRIDEAIYEHDALERALRTAGVRVRHLIHLALEIGQERPEIIEEVRARALRIVRYSGPKSMVEQARTRFRRDLDRLDGETLFNILLLRPSVHLERHPGVRAVLPQVRLDTPLVNLHFLRDQQALTPDGYVLGRMSKPQRREEPYLTGALLRVAGARFAGEIRAPGTFEGGDFLPMGDFALLGTGDRTNASGVRQFLELPIGVDELAVVRQPRHPAVPGDAPDPMINMHLDTYLNAPGAGIVVGCGPLLDRARTEVFVRSGRRLRRRSGPSVSLREYLRSKRFEVVEISTLEQMSYASNFLCVRDRRILSVAVEEEFERVLTTLANAARDNPHRYGRLLTLARREREQLLASNDVFPHKRALRELGVEAVPLHLQEITGGYGGAHCMTCVTRRAAT